MKKLNSQRASKYLRPLVSVVVLCRNESTHIDHCLAGFLNFMPPPGGFEVIIVDGMSDDGTREILARLAESTGGQLSVVTATKPQPSAFLPQPSTNAAPSSIPAHPTLRVIDNPGRIVPTGLNAAIRAARGDIIIRLDAHTDYAPDYLRECVATLEATGADNVGGPARTRAETLLGHAIAAAYHSPFSVGGARFHNVNYEGCVDTVTYGCWPRSTFEKFGYFDEELVRNQDDEHNLRIIRGGGKIYQSPKIKSWYKPRSSLASLFKQYMQYGYWKVRVIQKHKLPASWRHLVPGAFVLGLGVLFLLSAIGFLASHLFPLSNFSFPWPVKSFSYFTGHLSTLSFGMLNFSFQLSAFSFCFLAALSVYALCVLIASLLTAAKTEWKLLPILPLVFPCYHFGYGLGFLRGIWDFVLRRKGAHKSFETLTR